MTDTSYLYQYFLEKSSQSKKAKDPFHPAAPLKKKNIKEREKEDERHE